jgi:hypothetical protein
MKAFAVRCALAVIISGAWLSNALAWGEPGHEIIGSIAQQILATEDPQAASNLRHALGGVSLGVAATWADCVRDVEQSGSTFSYHKSPFTPVVCTANFHSAAAIKRMVDYASRNWANCVYAGSRTKCHAAFHFADIPVQEGRYDDSVIGANDHDVVHAINAAILALSNKVTPAPFSITSKREALFLLAHFVGDLHQPLHVGAIYLDAEGKIVNPIADGFPVDYCETGVVNDCTVGGNFLIEGSKNLHSEWDTIATGYGTTASSELVTAATSVPKTQGEISDWAATWASDTVKQARSAFKDVSFSAAFRNGRGPNKWNITFTDRQQYIHDRELIQKAQLEKAGAHLAELLQRLCHDGCSD